MLTQTPFDLSVLAAIETLSRTNDIPGTAVSVLLVLFPIWGVRHPTVRAHADYRVSPRDVRFELHLYELG